MIRSNGAGGGRRVLRAAAAMLLLLAVAGPGPATAAGWSLQTLYSFCSLANCADGASPEGGLVMDAAGNLYGTTAFGGDPAALGRGALFQVAPGGGETVLHGFCQGECFDGATPLASLTIAKSGIIYGTTLFGAIGDGTVFEWSGGQFGVVYAFCQNPGCPDGASPDGPVAIGKKGALYGTAMSGGANNAGTVFGMTKGGTETVLYDFCALANCTDGRSPVGALVIGKKGELYGVTSAGGANNSSGAVFVVSRKGQQQVVYSFCSAAQCADGSMPMAGLVADSSGNLYGTTSKGGAHGGGTVFEVTPGGQETVLYSFCALASCADGEVPVAGLIMDQSGNLYGTTQEGGAQAQGTVFEVTPGGQETVLYSFCSQAACADGEQPVAPLIMDGGGNLYGTTEAGGTASQAKGTVFELSPQ